VSGAARDLTLAQLDAACARHGITRIPGRLDRASFRFEGGGRADFGGHWMRTKRRAVLADLIKRKEQHGREIALCDARVALQEAGAAVVQAVLACKEPMPFEVQDAAARCFFAQREYLRLGGAKATKEARDRARDESMRELNALVASVLGGGS